MEEKIENSVNVLDKGAKVSGAPLSLIRDGSYFRSHLDSLCERPIRETALVST